MYSKSILSFLTVSLLTLAKINGDIVNNYTGKCNDVYKYLEGQGKVKNIENCKVNEEGEVTELSFYPYCLKNEQLETLLSYNTIESLVILNLEKKRDIKFKFGCNSIPTNFEKLGTLTNLKSLDISGVNNLDLISSAPESLESLKINSVRLNERVIQANLFKNLISLKKLDVCDCDLDKNFLDRISDITTLEYLRLYAPSKTPDEYDYSSFKKLQNLTTLDLYCQYYGDIDVSKFLFALTNLKSLNFDDCMLNIPTDIENSWSWANLKNLEYLRLSKFTYKGYGILLDVNELGDLTSLKELYLEQNRDFEEYGDDEEGKEFMTEFPEVGLPESIGNLKNIEIIKINCNSINSIPKSIGNLENLKILDLNRNYHITSIPEEIGNLKNLEELYLEFGKITSLPESIGNLDNLRILDAAFNKIEYLPTSIGNLSNLNGLEINFNAIKEIPKSIGDLPNLTSLSFYGNEIERIPDEIGNIKTLEYIDLSENKITNIPSTLGSLENLVVLSLSENLIDDYLPESFNNLQKLQSIDLNHNINIKGKTLSIPSLTHCEYGQPHGNGQYPELCEVPGSPCTFSSGRFKKCDDDNESTDVDETIDYAETTDVVETTDDIDPTDYVEPVDDVDPTHYVEPIDDVEPTDYIEPTDYAEPTEVIDFLSQPKPSKELLEYHQQCLKELKPYEICDEHITLISMKRRINKEEADSLCDAYEKAHCREFFRSPLTYAPTCEKTVDTFEYDIISSYNSGASVDIYWGFSRSNLYCAKKSSGEYCNLFEGAMILFDNEDYNMDVSAACGEKQCRESLIDYFDALIEEDYFDDDVLEKYQNKIKYLQSEQCIAKQY